MVIKLEDCNNQIFHQICLWYYNWLGKENNETLEEIKHTFKHSINKNKLPQTFVALVNGEPAGMYQLAVFDDLNCRPDLYPWLINVFVTEKFRGQKICEELMQTVNNNAKSLNLKQLYLYTNHVGLYEKYGWKFIEETKTFKANSPYARIYKLEIK